MKRLATRLLLWTLILPCGGAAIAHGRQTDALGGFTPEEAVRRMVVPEGFHVEVFAAEPMIRQPVTASFDERGRLWVVEYLQYPNPAGLKPVTVDQYLRTEYDKVPEPPPRGPRARTGSRSSRTPTETDGPIRSRCSPRGSTWPRRWRSGRGACSSARRRTFCSTPTATTTTGPTATPEVLLAGFGLQDAHATVNSMTWGPDGWLYGAGEHGHREDPRP